ncbi:MAG: TlpA family protein disulfide reductase [Desulfobulbaceae bacterium]|uniref:TlpA family protein disulfide reductase n=1 Tax=Candidatus Desulfatifera sulfidica TaxID=2841691 RepID=A0A8J6N9Y6_9BACT|nr:TlpA family protein disulfide reductase [Candidatus Desulfatifera sulfidica]
MNSIKNIGRRSLFFFLSLVLLAVPVQAGTSMPSFSLADALTGSSVKSDAFEGKTLLVTFFATWCPPCIQEIPTLISLQEELADENFSVLALSVDQAGPSVVAQLIRQRDINYPVLMAKGSTARDFGGVVGIPTSFLINSSGQVVKKYPGYVPHKILKKDIDSIIN